jgi:hypothetical protein
MIRRFFTIASALSLLLCVATVVLSLRSDGWQQFAFNNGHANAGWVEPCSLPFHGLNFVSVNGVPGPAGFHQYKDQSVRGEIASWGYDILIDPMGRPGTKETPISCFPGLMTYRGTGAASFRDGVIFRAIVSFGDSMVPPPLVPYSRIVVSFWVLIIPSALLATPFVFQIVRIFVLLFCWRRAARMGLCRQCGYDLRASKHRCPECGAPIPSKVEATA